MTHTRWLKLEHWGNLLRLCNEKTENIKHNDTAFSRFFFVLSEPDVAWNKRNSSQKICQPNRGQWTAMLNIQEPHGEVWQSWSSYGFRLEETFGLPSLFVNPPPPHRRSKRYSRPQWMLAQFLVFCWMVFSRPGAFPQNTILFLSTAKTKSPDFCRGCLCIAYPLWDTGCRWGWNCSSP